MTKEEFLEELGQLPKLGWKMGNGEYIRLWRPGLPNFSFCPITAVFFEKTKIEKTPGMFLEAALSMNLSEDLASLIANAADNCVSMNPRIDKVRQGVRREILEALNAPLRA